MQHMIAPEAPILPARECPPELLPKNVLSAASKAEANGWRWTARVAIAADGTRSVVFYAGRGRVRISARFVGPADGSKLSFESGWRMPGALGVPDRLGWRNVLTNLKAPDPDLVLTASGLTAEDA